MELLPLFISVFSVCQTHGKYESCQLLLKKHYSAVKDDASF